MRMPTCTRFVVFAVLGLAIFSSCGGGGPRCTEKQLEPYRRYECVPKSKGAMCDIHNQPAQPLTSEQQAFVDCCLSNEPGEPSCKESGEKGN